MGLSSDTVQFEQSCTEKTIPLEHDNYFLIYTDGLTEATNPDKDFYGAGRLFDVLSSGRPDGPESLINTIMADVERFTHGSPFHDDLTMLVMQVV
jgi:sigma-B regulation protein RsbU (phosphoserine phosphatase)